MSDLREQAKSIGDELHKHVIACMDFRETPKLPDWYSESIRVAMSMALEWAAASRGHRYCEDCWYTCPKHPEGCCDDQAGDKCNCSHDVFLAEAARLRKP